MQAHVAFPGQLGSQAHPRPDFPAEQKKPLKHTASPHAKQEPSSHATPERTAGVALSSGAGLDFDAEGEASCAFGSSAGGVEPPHAPSSAPANGQKRNLLTLSR
jgi:hypothetical protein